MMRITTFLFFCLGFYFLDFSQLNGSYTVGKPGDDFSTVDTAILVLQDQGVSGPVTFLVSNGQYDVLTLMGFQPPSGDSLVIRSASGNPDSVRFAGANLSEVYNVTLLDLGFFKTTNDHLSVVKVQNCYPLMIRRCILRDGLTTDYDYGESTLKIRHAYETPLSRVFIDSCHISSLDAQNHSPYEYVVTEWGTEGRTYYLNDTILGGWDLASYYREFTNCFLQTDEGLNAAGNMLIKDCQIDFLDAGNQELRAGTIDGCEVYGTYDLRIAADSIVNSEFVVPVNFSGGAPDIIRNRFYQKFSSSGYTGFIEGNVFLNTAQVYENPTLLNNFFLGDATFYGGAVYHNSFGPDSHFTYGGLGAVQQNNIHRFSTYGPNVAMFGNNFSGSDQETLNSAYFDSNPTFYDPEYVGTEDLHMRNPALFSRGFEVYGPAPYDVDDEPRAGKASIGADETCLQLPLRDTVFLECGTDYALKSCASLSGLQWKPASVVGGTQAAPTVLVDGFKLIWLEDASGNHIDSMYLSPLPATGSGKRTFEVECGQWGFYATYVPPGGTLSWEPASAVSNPFSHSVIITPDTNMIVVANVDLGACGSKSDTLEFIVDPMPASHILFDSIQCNTIFFKAYIKCYDSLLWHFSDGTTSTDPMLTTHTFPDSDLQQLDSVWLTVWHEGLSATSFTYAFVLGCVGLEENTEESFKMYPNPVSEMLRVEMTSKSLADYRIIDQSGRLLMQGTISDGQTLINVAPLSQGMYFLSVAGQQQLFRKE